MEARSRALGCADHQPRARRSFELTRAADGGDRGDQRVSYGRRQGRRLPRHPRRGGKANQFGASSAGGLTAPHRRIARGTRSVRTRVASVQYAPSVAAAREAPVNSAANSLAALTKIEVSTPTATNRAP